MPLPAGQQGAICRTFRDLRKGGWVAVSFFRLLKFTGGAVGLDTLHSLRR